jgi:predicted SnoaL-like aldol condensation-catalyzing enzyme
VLIKVSSLGIRMTMDVKKNLTEGDFLVTHRLYRTHPPHPEFKMINVFDLFRMTDEGQADEHWDIMEEIASPEHLEKIF